MMTSPIWPALLLAATFALAAFGKARTWPRFVDYVRTHTGNLTLEVSRTIAALIVAFEVVLATSLVLTSQLYVFAASVVFLLAATAFLGYAHLRSEGGACACFGSNFDADLRVRDVTRWAPPREIIREYLRPLFEVLRNSTLIGVACWGLTTTGADSAVWLLIAASSVVMIILLSVSVSIEEQKMRAPAHPRKMRYVAIIAPLVIMDYYRPVTSRR